MGLFGFGSRRSARAGAWRERWRCPQARSRSATSRTARAATSTPTARRGVAPARTWRLFGDTPRRPAQGRRGLDQRGDPQARHPQLDPRRRAVALQLRRSTASPRRRSTSSPLEWFLAPGVVAGHDREGGSATPSPPPRSRPSSSFGHDLQPLDIVLVRTGRDAFYDQLDYMAGPGVTREATEWLFERGVRVMGIDAWGWDALVQARRRSRPTSGASGGPQAAALSQIERLHNLGALPQTGFEVSGLPLRIVGRERRARPRRRDRPRVGFGVCSASSQKDICEVPVPRRLDPHASSSGMFDDPLLRGRRWQQRSGPSAATSWRGAGQAASGEGQGNAPGGSTASPHHLQARPTHCSKVRGNGRCHKKLGTGADIPAAQART